MCSPVRGGRVYVSRAATQGRPTSRDGRGWPALFCLIIRHSLRQPPHTFDFLNAPNALQDVDYLLEMLRIVYVDC